MQLRKIASKSFARLCVILLCLCFYSTGTDARDPQNNGIVLNENNISSTNFKGIGGRLVLQIGYRNSNSSKNGHENGTKAQGAVINFKPNQLLEPERNMKHSAEPIDVRNNSIEGWMTSISATGGDAIHGFLNNRTAPESEPHDPTSNNIEKSKAWNGAVISANIGSPNRHQNSTDFHTQQENMAAGVEHVFTEGNETKMKVSIAEPNGKDLDRHVSDFVKQSKNESVGPVDGNGNKSLKKDLFVTPNNLTEDLNMTIKVTGKKTDKDKNAEKWRLAEMILFRGIFGFGICFICLYSIVKAALNYYGRPKALECYFCDLIYQGMASAFVTIGNLLNRCYTWVCVRSPLTTTRLGYKGRGQTESTADLTSLTDYHYSL